MNDAKRSLRLADLRQSRADGLVVDEPHADCGCSLDDFAPCGDGPYPECVAARSLTVPADRRLVYCGQVYYCGDFEPGDAVFVPLSPKESRP